MSLIIAGFWHPDFDTRGQHPLQNLRAVSIDRPRFRDRSLKRRRWFNISAGFTHLEITFQVLPTLVIQPNVAAQDSDGYSDTDCMMGLRQNYAKEMESQYP
jgi:hypothetical protein